MTSSSLNKDSFRQHCGNSVSSSFVVCLLW